MAADWFNLGLQLDMDDAQLWIISGEQRRAVECFKMTLREWLRSGNATHSAVSKALRFPGLEQYALAEKLRSKGLCYVTVCVWFNILPVSTVMT